MGLRYLYLLLVISLISGVSCSPGSDRKYQIDYAKIPPSDIQKEFTITESEDYLPGAISRVMVSDDGYILVSQRREKSIHQFDPLGNYLRRVAGPGRGPGELSQHANAHFNGQILVMSNNHGILTEYRQNENGMFEYKTDHNIQLPGPMRGIRSKNDFRSLYVSVDSARIPFGKIPPEFTTDFVHLVRLTPDSLQVEKNILSLRKHSHYIEITNGGNSMRYSSLPYRYSDHFRPLSDKRILVQRPGKSLIQIYDKNMTLIHELKLNVKDRLVTEQDMEYHFPELSRSERSKRKNLIKDVKPPFIKVRMDSQQRFWLLTDVTEKGKEWVIVNYEGSPLGRLLLPEKSILYAVKGGKLYLVNRDGVPTIEVYSHTI